jgi:hypothetical protein
MPLHINKTLSQMPPFEHVFQQNILRTLHTTGGFNNTAEDYRCYCTERTWWLDFIGQQLESLKMADEVGGKGRLRGNLHKSWRNLNITTLAVLRMPLK